MRCTGGRSSYASSRWKLFIRFFLLLRVLIQFLYAFRKKKIYIVFWIERGDNAQICLLCFSPMLYIFYRNSVPWHLFFFFLYIYIETIRPATEKEESIWRLAWHGAPCIKAFIPALSVSSCVCAYIVVFVFVFLIVSLVVNGITRFV